MRFASPWALLLLLLLPYFVWLGRPHRGQRDGRAWATLLLRLLIVLLLIFSLAGAQAVRAADELAVVFLIDASDSMSTGQQEAATTYVREAMSAMEANDQAAVVVFGANALVERPMSGLASLSPITSVPQGLQTDVAEAIRLGLALFPPGSARRLVLLSDGAATVGDAAAAAQLAASAGVPIDYVPLQRTETAEEAWLSDVTAPSRVVAGEQFTIEITAMASTPMAAQLRVSSPMSIVYERDVTLQSGANHFSLPLRATEPSFARYTVELVPARDEYYQNNRLAAFTDVTGPPRLLLVDGSSQGDEETEARYLQAALSGAGLPATIIGPGELTASLAQLRDYASIILVNVNAKDLHPRKMEALQSYVRDLGGGLVVVGGPTSYGMGGYFRTPLEETLPVDMQIKDQDRFPAVSIVIIIDRSGSMAMPEGGLTKIQLADEAAVRVVELLNDFDEITVIPVDTQPSGTIGPVSAADKESIIAQIRQIGAGGGGINVRTGMEAAVTALAASENEVKHIILLADGNDSNEQTGVPALITDLVAANVTVSTVAIGDGKDVPWLRQMAELGQGRFHLTEEAANLPQIFTQETTSIQRSYLVEERFFPALRNNSPIVATIRQVPPLYGYVATSPKEAGQVVLETELGDPLLATWQYGLGRSLAWTSDATARWARDWVGWDGFSVFWAQAVRWTIVAGRESNVEAVVSASGETARLTVDARDGDGNLLDALDARANIVGPDGESETIALAQTAPGRYEGSFTPENEGAYLIRIDGREEGTEEAVVAQTSGWVLGYSPEYRPAHGGGDELARLAAISNGRDIGGDAPAAFAHTLAAERATRPIWPWLTLVALLLLPADVAMRRLALTRRDFARLVAAVRRRFGAQPVPTTRPQQVDRLFAAKERAAPRTAAGAAPDAGSETVLEDAAPVATPAPAEQTAPPPATTAQPVAQEETSTLAARLLARKRAEREEEDDAPKA